MRSPSVNRFEFRPGSKQDASGETSAGSADPVAYWAQTSSWPPKYFEQNRLVKEAFAREPFLGEQRRHSILDLEARIMVNSSQSLTRRGSSQSSLGKRPRSNAQTPSDQLPREVKSNAYGGKDFAFKLQHGGSSYMGKAEVAISDDSKRLCAHCLQSEQIVPKDSLFDDGLFEKLCAHVFDRNEALIIQDVTRLIVPSAVNLAMRGAANLDNLYESVNEGWNRAEPIRWFPRPQPDYSVGFRESAFTDMQLQKIQPLAGSAGPESTSRFMGTSRMFFPFLSCEVKAGAVGLDDADWQNAHTMTLAVRGVVELYTKVKRQKELHREILAFSVSHDYCSVRIYGHYALTLEDKPTFYRHSIRRFDFTEQDGKERWSAYKFTRAVYDWASKDLLKKLCSAIEDLPLDNNLSDNSLEVLQLLDVSQEGSDFEARSSPPSAFASQSTGAGSRGETPMTWLAENAEQSERGFKKPRLDR